MNNGDFLKVICIAQALDETIATFKECIGTECFSEFEKGNPAVQRALQVQRWTTAYIEDLALQHAEQERKRAIAKRAAQGALRDIAPALVVADALDKAAKR